MPRDGRDISPVRRALFGLVTLVGMVGAWSLSARQFTHGDGCPVLVTVPACYVVLMLYAGAHLWALRPSPTTSALSIASVVIGVIFAGSASAMQLMGVAQCPQSSFSVPMCYVAFALFVVATVLRFTGAARK